MTDSVLAWLAKNFSTTNDKMKDTLNDENATSFLLVWPIMEQKVFEGFLRKQDIDPKSKEFTEFYLEFDIELMTKHFYDRYQDPEKYRQLKHKDIDKRCDNILLKEYETLAFEDKLYLMFYVVYRYRNNIFHGNKGIKSWSRFTPQIDYCIQFMTQVVDCYKKNFGGRTA